MNPYARPQAYREASVMTASPEQLVVMLYDGAGRFLRQAEGAMNGGGTWLPLMEREPTLAVGAVLGLFAACVQSL